MSLVVSILMIKYIPILLLFYSGLANAVFSAFVNINSESQENNEFNIEVKPTNEKNKYSINLSMMYGEKRYAWLIICENSLSSKKQNFRNYIWHSDSEGRNIIVKIPLDFKKNRFSEDREDNLSYANLILDKKFIKSSYIYIDSPVPIFDGGFYYAIDLGSYVND